MAASTSFSASIDNSKKTDDVQATKLLVSFDEPTSSGTNLTVQTNELVEVQKQVIVTPSPANNHSASPQFNSDVAHIYNPPNEFGSSMLLSPTLSQLQRNVKTQLQLTSSTSLHSTASYTPSSTTDPSSSSTGSSSFLPNESPNNDNITSAIHSSSIPASAPALSGSYSSPSQSNIARIRRLDTVTPHSSRPNPTIYTTDRYIIPNRVQKHTQQMLYPTTTTTTSPKLRSTIHNSLPNFGNNEDSTQENISENQENLNPNLPL